MIKSAGRFVAFLVLMLELSVCRGCHFGASCHQWDNAPAARRKVISGPRQNKLRFEWGICSPLQTIPNGKPDLFQ